MEAGADAVKYHLEILEDKAKENAERWSEFERTPAEHLLIATEELGEVARAMQGTRWYTWPPEYNEKVYDELVDLGAVIVAMMGECEREIR